MTRSRRNTQTVRLSTVSFDSELLSLYLRINVANESEGQPVTCMQCCRVLSMVVSLGHQYSLRVDFAPRMLCACVRACQPFHVTTPGYTRFALIVLSSISRIQFKFYPAVHRTTSQRPGRSSSQRARDFRIS